MKLNTSGGDWRRGVIPDYKVSPAIEDITLGKDVEMELLLKVISEDEYKPYNKHYHP